MDLVWTLLLLFPLLLWLAVESYFWRLRSTNHARRAAVFKELGITSKGVTRILGFFHPYCNAGGGGERVLWTAIAATQRTQPNVVSVVYTGDTTASKRAIIDKVKARFDISLEESTLHFVFLKSRQLVEDSSWPHFTLLGQSIGSMYLAWEAMTLLIPDLYIDTMGYAFTFHVVSRLGRIPVGAYVHYPTISTDMLARIRSRTKWHTNADTISSSLALSKLKLLYYKLFMSHYALSLRTASFLMVNSSWTKSHVDAILKHNDFLSDVFHLFLFPLSIFLHLSAPSSTQNPSPQLNARIVYPPCDTKEMAQFKLDNREAVIISIAQFRPEKDHPAQLHSFSELLRVHPEYSNSDLKLVLVGGCRNSDDTARVEDLRALAKTLSIQDRVEFVVNASYPTILFWLSKASIGLSTMVDEHFGINIVEFMAAGVIPVTHASGGPLNDIVVPFNGKPTGYHATTPESFALALHTVLSLPPEEELALRQRARTWAVQRFSEEEFEKGWAESGWRNWIS